MSDRQRRFDTAGGPLLAGLGWVGGKSQLARNGINSWIRGALPPVVWHSTYVEPCAGMLGVLLARQRVRLEVVGDVNHRLVEWWQVVRDERPALIASLHYTPNAHEEFDRCLAGLDDGDVSPVERARRFTVVVAHGHAHSDRAHSSWRSAISPTGTSPGDWPDRLPDALADRLRHVRIERRDCAEMVERFAAEPAAVIYLDPPYRETSRPSGMYRHGSAAVDWSDLASAVQGARAAVAISGYGTEWDDLLDAGWRRQEHATYTTLLRATGAGAENAERHRTEVLWTNYPPNDPPLPGL